MLHRIIRLHAVLDIITDETATALELLAKQQTQMRKATYQNRLALDYLLAEEGGIYGKSNQMHCCPQINYNRKAVTEIAKNIRKTAHVPVQRRKGWDANNLLRGWFPLMGGLKTLVGLLLVIPPGCLLLPCLLPLLT